MDPDRSGGSWSFCWIVVVLVDRDRSAGSWSCSWI